jgi:FlaA1/EpsC-like NDP-sugar epimerase
VRDVRTGIGLAAGTGAPARPSAVRGWALLRELVQLGLLALATFGSTQLWVMAELTAWSVPLVRSLLALMALQWVGLRALRVHRRSWRYISLDDTLALLAGLTLGTGVHLVLDALLDAFRTTDIGPGGSDASSVLTVFIMLTALNLLVAVRAVRRLSVAQRMPDWFGGSTGSPSSPRHRALVVGAGRVGAGVIRDTFVHHGTPPLIVGFLDDDPHTAGQIINGVKVLGRTRDLESVARATEATMVIVALDQPDPSLLRSVIGRAQRTGLIARIRPSEPLAGIDRETLVVRAVDVADLMPRAAKRMDAERVSGLVTGRTVMVTGAGGSIGSELCRQLAQHRPTRLVLVDRSEHALWRIERELSDVLPMGVVDARLIDVTDRPLIRSLLRECGPSAIFHAAALKHVPLVERNVAAAVLNNVVGTEVLVSEASACGVPRFVLISSDKAVAPSSVMGATKRLAERIVSDAAERTGRDYVSVRFGNVLGSSGSVLEVFQEQIERGGPITITDPEMTRYFMTIPEASGLVLHAATLARRGEVLVLDMGEPHLIVDLARDLVRLNGLEPDHDIRIVTTGRRPGEKLHEALADEGEDLVRTAHPSILALRGTAGDWSERDVAVDALRGLAEADDSMALRRTLHRLATGGTLAEAAGTGSPVDPFAAVGRGMAREALAEGVAGGVAG